MRALLFDGRKLREVERPLPRPARGGALVRVRLAGICSTDLEILKGYFSFRGVPGHEFVGTVVSAPSGRLAGKRVVGEINVPCGRCALCRAGLGTHCPSREVLGIAGRDGAFAEYLTLPARNLHVVPAGLSDEEAAFTELVAAACEVVEQVPVSRRDRVLVLGDGRLAAMAAQVVSLTGSRVAVLGRAPRKLAVIRTLGIETFGSREGRRFGRRHDVVVDCTGSPAGLSLAASLVRPRGVIVLKSTYRGSLDWNPAPLVVDEITVVGSRCGPFERALDLLARRKISVRPFLTAVYPFERWERAVRRARGAGSFKVLMRMS
jgi:threonine dehydrogenase-like Zn-dependent dehydrogenase